MLSTLFLSVYSLNNSTHVKWPSLPFSLVVVYEVTGPQYLVSLDAGLCIQKSRAIIPGSGGDEISPFFPFNLAIYFLIYSFRPVPIVCQNAYKRYFWGAGGSSKGIAGGQ